MEGVTKTVRMGVLTEDEQRELEKRMDAVYEFCAERSVSFFGLASYNNIFNVTEKDNGFNYRGGNDTSIRSCHQLGFERPVGRHLVMAAFQSRNESEPEDVLEERLYKDIPKAIDHEFYMMIERAPEGVSDWIGADNGYTFKPEGENEH